jgi:DNA-binding NtrC family response regulator
METSPWNLRRAIRLFVLNSLEACDWNVTKAANHLDISRATLNRMITRYGLRRDQKSTDPDVSLPFGIQERGRSF